MPEMENEVGLIIDREESTLEVMTFAGMKEITIKIEQVFTIDSTMPTVAVVWLP